MAKRKVSPNPGLTPPELVSEVRRKAGIEDGKNVQKVRKPDQQQKKSILSKARAGSAGKPRRSGIFGATPVSDGEREAEASTKGGKVSDDTGRRERVVGLRELLEMEIKKQDPDEGCTYLQSIVRKVVEKAARGEQWAMLFVRDIVEGKPGQAPKRTQTIEDVEDAISQVELATLNKLLEDGDNE